MRNDKVLTALKNFDGIVTEIVTDDDLHIEFHDNFLLPFGCKRYDEWAECDIYELLGRE